MKRPIIALILLFIVSKGISQSESVEPPIKKVSAKDVRTMIDTTSMPMIVNFWASWCGPCIREIPWFDSIMARKNVQVKLMLVNLDFRTNYSKLSEFVKKHNYKGEVVFLDETDGNYFV